MARTISSSVIATYGIYIETYLEELHELECTVTSGMQFIATKAMLKEPPSFRLMHHLRPWHEGAIVRRCPSETGKVAGGIFCTGQCKIHPAA